MTIETLLLPGAVGLLEAMVTKPQAPPTAIGVICHPHPQQEGTMHNKVVTTLAKAFELSGAATLRFNFRGVGRSEGVFDDAVGERDDLRAMIRWANENFPGIPLWLGGFSFGGYIAARVANDDQVASRLITIAPAVTRYSFNDITRIAIPWLIVHGDQDDVVSFQSVTDWQQTMSFVHTPQLEVFEGVGHFFHGQLMRLRELLVQWLQ